LRRAPSCADPKVNGWGSAAEGLTHGQLDARPRYACPADKPSRVRGRTERDLIRAEPNALVDALHGVPRPRVRGTGKDVRDIVNPKQLMPWSKSEAQQLFLEGASAQELGVFRKISERVFASLRHEQDCAHMMRHLDPRGSGILTRKDFQRVLQNINLNLAPADFDDLLKRLHQACARFVPQTDKDADTRVVSIDFFLLVFDSDQRALPGNPGGEMKAAISRAPSAFSRMPSATAGTPFGGAKSNGLERASSAPARPPQRQERRQAWGNEGDERGNDNRRRRGGGGGFRGTRTKGKRRGGGGGGGGEGDKFFAGPPRF